MAEIGQLVAAFYRYAVGKLPLTDTGGSFVEIVYGTGDGAGHAHANEQRQQEANAQKNANQIEKRNKCRYERQNSVRQHYSQDRRETSGDHHGSVLARIGVGPICNLDRGNTRDLKVENILRRGHSASYRAMAAADGI